MSWRGREERGTRWEQGSGPKWETRSRSPVWELRRSVSPGHHRLSPHRDRHRHERDDRRDRDRRDRDRRDRDRDRKRSPRRYTQVPSPPSPPRISEGDRDRKSPSSSRSLSRDKDHDPEYDKDMQSYDDQRPHTSPGDWICKCGVNNFKRRAVCYRRTCNGRRSEGAVYSGDNDRKPTAETLGITKRLLLRRLDALTTEEKILETIKERCSKSVLDSIAGITIGRETLTGASKCLAFINFNTIADSTAAYTEMVNLQPQLRIDGREVLINYYNEPKKVIKSSNDYSSYYPQMPNYGNVSSSQALSEADRVNAAAAVAQSAINAAQARNLSWTPATVPSFGAASTAQVTAATKIPTGDGKTVYPPPDVRTFMYDETSGYYYDPATSLYYDGNTQYFYNSQINQYMYWDGSLSTYIAATQNTDQAKAQNAAQTETTQKEPEEKKKRDNKEDKVKVAKKIAKDMERWARTLNQKKENARSNIVMEQPQDTGLSKGSADIGYSVLGAGPSVTHVRELSPPPVAEEYIRKDTDLIDDDDGIIDWSKLTCLLCKRRFPSADVLTKHKTMSDLHKQNLDEFRKKNNLQPQMNGYRDRAAERRLKFGEDDTQIVRKRYEPELLGVAIASHPPPSVVDTIGGKMLQKMGWSEGRGLGKTEQGRVAPIEAHQRPGLAGLGQKRGIYTPTPGETYRDTVKKLMIARYKEVIGQEDEN